MSPDELEDKISLLNAHTEYILDKPSQLLANPGPLGAPCPTCGVSAGYSCVTYYWKQQQDSFHEQRLIQLAIDNGHAMSPEGRRVRELRECVATLTERRDTILKQEDDCWDEYAWGTMLQARRYG